MGLIIQIALGIALGWILITKYSEIWDFVGYIVKLPFKAIKWFFSFPIKLIDKLIQPIIILTLIFCGVLMVVGVISFVPSEYSKYAIAIAIVVSAILGLYEIVKNRDDSSVDMTEKLNHPKSESEEHR
jgi:hypothetical protein